MSNKLHINKDRRASAQTIVLNPEMFAALADMVQRTQEQKNAIPE